MGSAVRRRCPRGPDPPPEGRMPQPAGAREGVSPAGSSACGPVPEGLSVGAIGWSRLRSPGAPGRGRRGRALVRPFQLSSFTSWRSRSGALLGPRRGFDRPRRVVPAGGEPRYLVDSASSHMLVSKIKPCMSKYKQFVL